MSVVLEAFEGGASDFFTLHCLLAYLGKVESMLRPCCRRVRIVGHCGIVHRSVVSDHVLDDFALLEELVA